MPVLMAPPPPIEVKFLGTCTSPIMTRNYSSLLVKLGHDTVMMYDATTHTQRLW